jgi:hypothetical protein
MRVGNDPKRVRSLFQVSHNNIDSLFRVSTFRKANGIVTVLKNVLSLG